MKTSRLLQLFVAASALAAAGTVSTLPASASPIVGFGDPLGAISGGTQETFESVAPGDYSALVRGNVTYQGIGGDVTVNADFAGQFNTTGQSLYNGGDLLPDSFAFDFASPVDAFAFNFGASDNTWIMTVADSGFVTLETLLIPPVFGSGAGDYFGIAAPGIAHVILSDTGNNGSFGDWVFIDNFTTGGARVPPVPLPGALPLFASAMGVLGWLRLRRRSQGAAA